MTGITQATALWYASRATGIVSLVLLSAVVVLGVLVNRQGRLPGLPRFAVTGLHRSVSLIAVAFLGVHVLSAVADKYVSIRLAATIIPFTSSYQPVQIGLGAVALDLGIAMIVTSMLRARIGRRIWRAVHWLAYAAYPVALVHSVTSAKDLRSGGLLALTAACVLGVAGAAGYRVASTRRAAAQRTHSPELSADISITAAAGRAARGAPGGSGGSPPRASTAITAAAGRAARTAAGGFQGADPPGQRAKHGAAAGLPEADPQRPHAAHGAAGGFRGGDPPGQHDAEGALR